MNSLPGDGHEIARGLICFPRLRRVETADIGIPILTLKDPCRISIAFPILILVGLVPFEQVHRGERGVVLRAARDVRTLHLLAACVTQLSMGRRMGRYRRRAQRTAAAVRRT